MWPSDCTPIPEILGHGPFSLGFLDVQCVFFFFFFLRDRFEIKFCLQIDGKFNEV